jgi:hypothetical protein
LSDFLAVYALHIIAGTGIADAIDRETGAALQAASYSGRNLKGVLGFFGNCEPGLQRI